VPRKYISKPLKLFYRRRQYNLLQETKKFIAGGKTIYRGRKNNFLREEKQFVAGGKEVYSLRRRVWGCGLTVIRLRAIGS